MTPHLDHLLSPAPLAVVVLLIVACAALASRLRRAHRRIEELGFVDNLTGLGNRRLLERELPRELARARRARLSFFVCVADVDRLGLYNRSAGRPAGHALLAAIASVLRGSLRRAGDFAYRSHDGRFLFAFGSERVRDGAEMAERIRARVMELALFHPENVPHGFATISLGLVVVPADQQAPLAAVEERCAEALAVARKEGRNRTAALSLDGERMAAVDGVALTPVPAFVDAAKGAGDRRGGKAAP